MVNIGIRLRNTRIMVNDSLSRYALFDIQQDFSRFLYFKWICHLDLSTLYLTAGCDGCHTLSRRRLLNPQLLVLLLAGPISHTSIHYMD